MKVLVFDDLEDANVFLRDEKGFHSAIDGTYAETKFEPVVKKLDGEPYMVRRVDLLKGGTVYDLPPKQADSLVSIGKAEYA